MEAPIIEARRVFCRRPLGLRQVSIVEDFTVSIGAGERVSLVGAPGSGCTLALHLLGLLEPPDSGSVRFDGRVAAADGTAVRGEVRNRNFGFLFSAPFLLPDFSAAENVAMPLFKLGGIAPSAADRTVRALLEELGISAVAGLAAHELDAGAQALTALARALALGPRVLVIEAAVTGVGSGRDTAFRERLDRAVTARGLTCLVEGPEVVHGLSTARVLTLDRGRLVSDAKGVMV